MSVPNSSKDAFLAELSGIRKESREGIDQTFRIWVCREILEIAGSDNLDR